MLYEHLFNFSYYEKIFNNITLILHNVGCIAYIYPIAIRISKHGIYAIYYASFNLYWLQNIIDRIYINITIWQKMVKMRQRNSPKNYLLCNSGNAHFEWSMKNVKNWYRHFWHIRNFATSFLFKALNAFSLCLGE